MWSIDFQQKYQVYSIGKEYHFQQIVLKQIDTHIPKIYVDPYFILFTKDKINKSLDYQSWTYKTHR